MYRNGEKLYEKSIEMRKNSMKKVINNNTNRNDQISMNKVTIIQG